MAQSETPFLQEKDTCWRVERCPRAKVLIDGAAYYLALRRALRAARHSVFVVGWDIDSRTRLVGPEGEKDDDLPERFGAFLRALIDRNPALKIHLLLWDYSMLYALEREPLPAVKLDWSTPPQISVCLDDVLPVGASHHQKVVVVDDALAFSGGLDLTIRRWDTSDHAMANELRCDPAGLGYRPFHDIQMMVDGEAALSLAELARERWQRAACQPPLPLAPQGDPWPEGFEPDFTDTRVGIARTLPHYHGEAEVREIEQLFLRSVARTEHSLYIESQFLTAERFCGALIERLKEKPEIEVLVVAPNIHHTWLEEHSMNAGRRRFMRRLAEAGVADRLRLVYPQVPGDDKGEGVMVHSKVMIVDDSLLRIGSANLNNRSMGMDTECDLAVEARDAGEAAAIARLRHRLLGEHLGCGETEIAQITAAEPSLFALVDRFSEAGRSLQPIDLGHAGDDELSRTVGQLADPERPIETPEFIGDMFADRSSPPQASRIGKLLAAALLVLVLVGLWRFTPLAEVTDPERLVAQLQAMGDGLWAPLVLLGAYLLGSLVVFPVTVLIVVTGLMYPPLVAFPFALTASLLSAALTYAIGRHAGAQPLRKLMGQRINRVRRALSRHGVISVAVLRMVPIAPFTVMNLAAGASQIRFVDYIAGTFLGMAPGILVISLLGNQLGEVLSDPKPGQMVLLGAFIAAWIALSFGLQILATRLRRRSDA